MEQEQQQTTPEQEDFEMEVTDPIIINLGKQKRKRIKKLLKGRGPLWEEVEQVVFEVGDLLDEELDGKVIVPLVLVYRKKNKPKNQLRGMLGL